MTEVVLEIIEHTCTKQYTDIKTNKIIKKNKKKRINTGEQPYIYSPTFNLAFSQMHPVLRKFQCSGWVKICPLFMTVLAVCALCSSRQQCGSEVHENIFSTFFVRVMMIFTSSRRQNISLKWRTSHWSNYLFGTVRRSPLLSLFLSISVLAMLFIVEGNYLIHQWLLPGAQEH